MGLNIQTKSYMLLTSGVSLLPAAGRVGDATTSFSPITLYCQWQGALTPGCQWLPSPPLLQEILCQPAPPPPRPSTCYSLVRRTRPLLWAFTPMGHHLCHCRVLSGPESNPQMGATILVGITTLSTWPRTAMHDYMTLTMAHFSSGVGTEGARVGTGPPNDIAEWAEVCLGPPNIFTQKLHYNSA